MWARTEKDGRAVAWLLTLFAACFFLAAGLAAFAPQNACAQEQGTAAPAAPVTMPIRSILADPAGVMNTRVAVSGRVADVVSEATGTNIGRYTLVDNTGQITVLTERLPQPGERKTVVGAVGIDPFTSLPYIQEIISAVPPPPPPAPKIPLAVLAGLGGLLVVLVVVLIVVYSATKRREEEERRRQEEAQRVALERERVRAEREGAGERRVTAPVGAEAPGAPRRVTTFAVGTLEVVEGPEKGAVYSVIVPETKIGQESGRDVLSGTADKTISGAHATIAASPDGTCSIRNESRYGTKLNGRPVTESPLKDGDTIQVGATVLRFKSGTTAAGAPEPGRRVTEPVQFPGHPLPSERPTSAVPASGTATRQFLNAELVVVAGPDQGKSFPVTSNVTTIGRKQDRDVVVNDDTVSRVQASLHFEDGAFRLQNESDKGTQLNGTPIVARAELHSGDKIQMGSTVLEFRTR